MNLQVITPPPRMVDRSLAIGSGIQISTQGVLGRAEGYAERADAFRAARQISRGWRPSAAVVGYENRWYLYGLSAHQHSPFFGKSWGSELRFEGANPYRVGPYVRGIDTPFTRNYSGLEAIVDGGSALVLKERRS